MCDRLFGYFSTINIVFLFALFVALNAIKLSNEREKKKPRQRNFHMGNTICNRLSCGVLSVGWEGGRHNKAGRRPVSDALSIELIRTPCFDRFYPFVILQVDGVTCASDFFPPSFLYCHCSVARSQPFRNKCAYWDVDVVVVGN